MGQPAHGPSYLGTPSNRLPRGFLRNRCRFTRVSTPGGRHRRPTMGRASADPSTSRHGTPCFLLRRAGCFCPSPEPLLQPPFRPSPDAVKPPYQVRRRPLPRWNRPVALPPPSSPSLDSSLSRPSRPDSPLLRRLG